MNRRPTARASAGFTIVEFVVALGILLAIGWVSVLASTVASRTSMGTVHISQLDQRVHRVITRVSRELQEARMDSLLPDPVKPYGASTLTYRCAELAPAGGIIWGNYRRLELISPDEDPDDGTDNDGDGLVDERELRLVRDVGLATENVTVLSRGVARLLAGEQANVLDDNGNELLDEPGFCVARRQGVLEIRLSLQSMDLGGEITTRTAETTVWPRN